jgi:hypothetical protein
MEIIMPKRILLMIAILAVFLASCTGTKAPPTMSPADVQNTAVAAAYTMVAATQLAAPTIPPPLPPTEIPSPTPLPTFTPPPLQITPQSSIPTLPPLIPPTPTRAASSLGSDPCNQILDVVAAGPAFPMRVLNQTGGTIILSLYLYTNLHGQCGYLPGIPQIAAGDTYTATVPTGNWSYFALVDLGNNRSAKSYGNFVVGSSGAQELRITKQ